MNSALYPVWPLDFQPYRCPGTPGGINFRTPGSCRAAVKIRVHGPLNPQPFQLRCPSLMTAKHANGLPTAEDPAVPAASQPETDVFAVFGAEPEVQAYAMAKYSR